MNIEDVIEVYERYNSGSQENFLEAEKMKEIIILHKKNIWILLQNIVNPDFEPPLQLFIIRLVNEILKLSFKSLPLYSIMEIISQIIQQEKINEPSLNENIFNAINDLYGLLKFIIYVVDERFCFDYENSENESEEEETTNKFEYFEFYSFFKYFISPPNFLIETLNEKKIITLFLNTQLKSLLVFLFDHIEQQINEPIIILNQCLTLLIDQTKKQIIFLSEFNQVLNESLIEILTIIQTNFENFSPSNVIDLLSNVLNLINLNDVFLNQKLFECTINILMLIIENPESFLNEEEIINSFCNLMLNFPIDQKILDHCSDFCSSFINLIHLTLHENYFLSIRILSSSTEFLYNVYDYIPRDSDLFQSYLSFFESFFYATYESINQDPIQTFNCLFYGYDELKTTQKILISLLQASEIKIDSIVMLLIKNFNDLIKNENQYSLIFDVKISLIIYITSIIIRYDFFDSCKNKSDQNLTVFLFNFFIESSEKLGEYKIDSDLAELYASERMIIEFLRIFIKKFISNRNKKELSPIIPLSTFDGYNSTVIFIFSRLWYDVVFDIQLKQVSEVISLFLNSHDAVEILTTTDFLQNCYDSFLSLPCKYIVHDTISKVAFAAQIHSDFIEKVYDCLSEKLDEISVNHLFKFLSAFFQNASTNELWQEIYFLFTSKFVTKCIEISENNENKFVKFLLKFLIVFIQSVPNCKFESIEPESYQLLIIELLMNIERNILEEVPEEKDDFFDFDDERWNNIELSIHTFTLVLKSNSIISGIVGLTEDQNVFQLFSLLINVLSCNSPLSLLSHPQIILYLSDLLNSFAHYFGEELGQDEQFWNFYIIASKVILLSNNSDSINLISQSLSSLLGEYSNLLRNHFALAFDALEKNDDLFLTVEFLIQFYYIDEEFVFEFGKLIENDLDDELKIDFNSTYMGIWKYIAENERERSRHEIVLHIYNMIKEIQIKWCNLPCLDRCFII